MIEINEVFENVQSLAQKAKHGTIRVADFIKYANLASMDLFNEKLGPERDYYKLGKAIPKTGPGMNKMVDQALKPYLVDSVPIALVGNIGTLPTNCEYVDDISTASDSLKWVPNNKIKSYLNSSIDVPTMEYPIYTDLNGQVKVYPTMTTIYLTYYKTPETVDWKYTLVNNRPVYNPTGSVNFSWHPTQKLELITRILGYVGITIRDTELINYSEQQENTIA